MIVARPGTLHWVHVSLFFRNNWHGGQCELSLICMFVCDTKYKIFTALI